nr:hypothetical protein [Liquorilactobacillus satsumensis]
MDKDLTYFMYRLETCLEEAIKEQQQAAGGPDSVEDDLAMLRVLEELENYIDRNEFLRCLLYQVYQKICIN